jgi:thiol-disulfide isomerase/thioredoxin
VEGNNVTGQLREKAVYLAAWMPTLLASLTVLTTIMLWRARRTGRLAAKAHKGASLARLVAWFILPGCLIGLVVAYGPMAPLFRSAERLNARVGDLAPDMTFTQFSDGSVKHVSDFRGKVLLVNLWATWCPPCRKELPTLNRLQEALGDRGLVVITLTDESGDRLPGFLGEHAPRTVNGRVDSFGWLAIKEFRPFTLVIDRAGRLRDYSFGEQDYKTFVRKSRNICSLFPPCSNSSPCSLLPRQRAPPSSSGSPTDGEPDQSPRCLADINVFTVPRCAVRRPRPPFRMWPIRVAGRIASRNNEVPVSKPRSLNRCIRTDFG